ncbi:hypothetical protein K388_07329 [Streptomyces sp. KhCrAH-43]|uniref:hypothetical protein n=1 Tax=unclassified Streptomyces TaxID=2593676 RepID=UPI000378551B|nr:MULTISPECIES: hypothetical protein [unclassified Streptomyces]MYS37205.1 hypothetical protein [Streptomyces sp. SID4920]MYX68630.1 hypothetical protein [Streptomyces sp. SID8373]RAJ45698.1 hypothetical protein K388_07329 [Streptomyces sp. KhCrAH-43]
MNRELLHGDLCPLCGRPLTLRPSVVVHSNVQYPTRADAVPHCASCASCASDMLRAQEWAELMRARYES